MSSFTYGHSTGGSAAMAGARPMVLLRYRPGVAGETARTVHLVPLPCEGQTSTAGVALCGALLRPDQVETVIPGHGVPCSLCVVSHADTSASDPPAPADALALGPPSDDTRPLAAAVGYRLWGWPVTLRGDQVWLDLEPETVALIIPVLLAEQVTAILRQRRCPPLVLAYPDMPEHRVLLASERYGVALPWPSGVHRATGIFPLPPTVAVRGPVTWVYPPEVDALRLCREIDVFGAVRTAQHNPST
ncbi:MAG: hypothetical protein ACT4NP_19125 [Pseudonocardiales bacterium]